MLETSKAFSKALMVEAGVPTARAITVDNVNDAPTDISLDASPIPNRTLGAEVGILTATDVDLGDTFTYTLASDPSGKFEIVGDTLKLRDDKMIDHELIHETFRALPADQFPHIASHAEAMTSGDGEDRFLFAIDTYVRGLLAG